MNGNRFYVHPAGDISQGLQGLSQSIQSLGEQRRLDQMKKEAVEAYQSGDPDRIAEVSLQHPEIAEFLIEQAQFRSESTKQNFLDSAYSVIADPSPENIQRVVEARQAFLRSQGQTDEDMPFTGTFLDKYNEDPEKALTELKMDVAGLDPERWTKFKEALAPAETEKAKKTANIKDIEYYNELKKTNPELAEKFAKLIGLEKKETTPTITEFEYGEKHPEFLLQQQKAADEKKTEELEKQQFTSAMALRKEFLSQSNDYQKVRDSYARVINSTKDPSPAGDLSLIFNYMKMLDPGSVVRESEFATAASTGSYGERLKAAAKKIMQGERLSDEMRNDFVSKAKELLDGMEKQHKKRSESYKNIAQKNKLPIDQVVIDITGAEGINDPLGIR